jgi:hypothetical protein
MSEQSHAEPRLVSSAALLLEQAIEEQRDHWRKGQRLAVESVLERHPILGSNYEAMLDLEPKRGLCQVSLGKGAEM